ncbi:hypothetical protein EMIHUDRAFT_117084 [Emiliania huxleyi CCMP1516]|uniref:Peptidylprolyl isomerase n=2 Tax=Emiliania huxleyi TaxID=2903 RepID=A0A0D3JDH9_EMIH1|nr:hypothetical protein EMIHUDRAFT_117084 [Emiliania huxleyi CCMP1516]EOD21564.1 hypothetical protein EMIHUDRAFT_117084 [Emiliania huxleyi CCMP1516]|eukprot:XP_005773993.1 hypothetical protein EMIHUDRAFT_117084 [Emiliania huxleyi CCMP1516]
MAGVRRIIALMLAVSSAAPTPASCDDWAASGECDRNAAFMWESCESACTKHGFKDPRAAIDEMALAGPPAGGQVLELRLASGANLAPIRIDLRPDLSPITVAAVIAAVGKRGDEGTAATFYRNEAVPTAPPGQCGEILCGPYSLIQGRLPGLRGTPTEGQAAVRKGYVARIQDGDDFFIALDAHAEWGHSFTIWGELRDAAGFETLEAIARLPYHETTGAGGTVMRLLDTELPTRGAIVAAAASAESALNREL